MDSLSSRVSREVRWTVLEKWGGRLVTAGLLVILARYVSPSDFGIIALVAVVTSFVAVLVDSGFARTLVQQREIDDADCSTVFWFSVGVGVIATICVFSLAPLLGATLHSPGLVNPLRVLSCSAVLTSLSGVPAALLERNLEFRALSLRVLIGTLAGAGVAIPVAVLGGGMWSLVVQNVVTQVVSLVALWRASTWRPGRIFSLTRLKRLSRFGVGVLGIGTMNVVQMQSDKLVVGVLLGSTELGYYFVAQRLLVIVLDLSVSVVSRLTLTTFSKVQSDRIRVARGYHQLTFIVGGFGVCVFALLAFCAAELIPLTLGPMWSESIPIMQILCISYALACITYFDKDVLLAVGRPAAALRLGALENVLGIATLLVSAPLGIVAVSVGRSLQRVIFLPYRGYEMRRCAGIDVLAYVRTLGLFVCALGVAAGVVFLASASSWRAVPHTPFLFTLPVALLAASVYCVVLILLAGPAQRRAVRRIALGVVTR